MPILPSGAEINAGWLGEQLGCHVERLEIEPLGVPQGFTSNTMRLKPQGCSDDLPSSLILKIDSEDPHSREIALKLNCFRREVCFYRTFASIFSSLVPRVYATGNGTSDEGRWLLMEDLSAMKVGNQVRGVTADASCLVLDAIAQVQARFWNAPSLHGYDWLPDHQFWFQGSTEILSSFHPNFLNDYELRVEPEALRAIEFVIYNSQAIDGKIAQRPSTLVHGDLRVENVLFGTCSKQRGVVIIDWGTPTRSLAAMDLAYFIGGSVPMPARRNRLRDLCASWHHSLVAYGVTDYTLEDAWSDFQLASLRCLSSVLLLHNWQLDPSISSRAILLNDEWIERSSSLVVELDVLEKLPSLVGCLS